jgi:hypothetical protein
MGNAELAIKLSHCVGESVLRQLTRLGSRAAPQAAMQGATVIIPVSHLHASLSGAYGLAAGTGLPGRDRPAAAKPWGPGGPALGEVAAIGRKRPGGKELGAAPNSPAVANPAGSDAGDTARPPNAAPTHSHTLTTARRRAAARWLWHVRPSRRMRLR